MTKARMPVRWNFSLLWSMSLGVLALGLAGCFTHSGADLGADPPRPGFFTKANNQQTVELARNQILTLSLVSAISGEPWVMQTPPEGTVLVFVSRKTTMEPMGGSREARFLEEWKFRAVGPGTATIRLSLAGTKPDNFWLRVTVP